MRYTRPGVLRRWRAGWMATVALAALLAAGLPAVAAAHDEGGVDEGCPYVVQFGDTLASIAQRGGVTIGEVMQVNGLHNPDLIYIGQTLLVPCGDMGGGQPNQGGQGGYNEPMPMPHDGGGDMGGGQPNQGGQGGYNEPMPMPHDGGGDMGGGQPNQGGQGGYNEPMPMPHDGGGDMGGGQPNQGGQGGYNEPMPMPHDGGGDMGGGQPNQGGQGGYNEPMPMPHDGGGDMGGGQPNQGGKGGPMEPMPYPGGGGDTGMDGHGWMGPMPGNDWDSHPDMDFWRGSYFKDKYFSEFVEERQDPEVRFNWYTDSPGPNIPNDRFSVRWERFLTLPGGHYVFFATADDGVRVIVDDSTVIDAWKIQPATDYEADVFLQPGKHKIVVEYYEEAEDAQVSVHWKQLGH